MILKPNCLSPFKRSCVTITLEWKGQTMNLEIHKPELVRRVNAQPQSGQFHDVDEVI